MNTFHLLTFITISTLLSKTVATNYSIFCYWKTWSYYNEGTGKFQAWNIEPKLCTHLAYAFFGIGKQGEIKILDKYLALDLELIRQAIAEKSINPNLKVLASVGGWWLGSKAGFSIMTTRIRKMFISTTLTFLAKYKFDGIDLDWEYLTQRTNERVDEESIDLLFKELKNELSRNQYLLTIAMNGNLLSATRSYDIAKISKYADLINLMAYDFNGSSNAELEYNAPLRGKMKNTVESVVDFWISKIDRSSKILLGLPFYGHSFTLADTTNTTIGTASRGVGLQGTFTRHPGVLAYNEFCLQSVKWQRKFDNSSKVPYAFRDNQWLSYDDERSIIEKVKFLRSRNLGGATIWSLDMDDFGGICGVRYPLLQCVNLQIGNSLALVTHKTTTENINMGGICLSDGYFPNTMDCTRFFECRSGVRENYQCLHGLLFDAKLGPYALITTSVSAELGQGGNANALATVTAIIDGTGSIGAAVGPLLAGLLSIGGWQKVFYMLIVADIIAMLLLTRLVLKEFSRLRRTARIRIE